jgi:hypothetical protein
MRIIYGWLLLFFLISCKKDNPQIDYPIRPTPNPSSNHSDTSFIRVSINDVAMQVTSIQYDRSSRTLHFSAANELQKVQVYCFHFYGSSGFNYQYSDSITYSTRQETLSDWYTRTASNRSDVFFNCCTLPTKDTPVDGTFTVLFDGKGEPLIKGNFHLKYTPNP